MKWLYFRSTNGINDDNGFISTDQTTNSTLRTSALLKYENLQAILPFDNTNDTEFPNGGSDGDYIGVVMVFKPSLNPGLGQDGLGTTKFINADKIYLQTTINSISSCEEIINFIEKSEENFIQFFDTNDDQAGFNCPGVIACKHIEIAQNHRT